MFQESTAAALLLLATPASAQTTAVKPQPEPVTVQQNAVVVSQQVTGDMLRAGAPVPVALGRAFSRIYDCR